MNGLLTQKKTTPVPRVGEIKRFVLEERVGKSGKAWTKIKNAKDGEGAAYEVMSVTATGWESDIGNVSFNLEIEPFTGQAPKAPQTAVERVSNDDPRHYMMRLANLLQMAHNAARAVMGEEYDHEDARSLFIAAQREGFARQMPDKPMNVETEEEEEPF